MLNHDDKFPFAPTHDQLITKIQRFFEHLQEIERNESSNALIDYYYILFEEVLCDEFI